MGSPPVTPNYDLVKPPAGETGWTNQVNGNWDIIDGALHALATGGSTGPAGPAGAAGPVGMIYAGPWAAIINYVVTDAVTFNGSFYIATANNVNAQPDTHPTSWSILAAAGAAGPQGPTGPAGPGGGTSIALPLALNQGGTGVAAANAAAARAALAAAASGANNDITSLTGIPNVVITTDLIQFSVPGQTFSLTAAGFSVVGGINCGNINVSGVVLTGGIISANPNSEITVGNLDGDAGWLHANNGFIVSGGIPRTLVGGEVGMTGNTAGTATPGGGQAVPGTVLGYILGNVGGTTVKIPYFAV
jgi:hypothetical protein